MAAVNATDPNLCQGELVHIQVIIESKKKRVALFVVKDQLAKATVCLTPQGAQIMHRLAQSLGLQ